jgi:hypothetical protein
MIPQLLLLLFLGLGISRAYTERHQTPGHLAKFYDILLFYGVLLGLMYWGGFFQPLIDKL